MKQVAQLTVVILLTLLLILILWQLRSVVLLFLWALAITAALNEPINLLIQRGLPKTWAILLVYLATFGSLGLLAAALFVPALQEIDPLVQHLLEQYGVVQGGLLERVGNRTVFIERLPSTEQVATWLAATQGEELAQTAVGATQTIGNILGQLILAIVIAIYWTADQTRFERLWLSLLSAERRTWARLFWHKMQANVGAYIRSEVAQSVIAAALFSVGYWLIGVEAPFTLALIGAVTWLLPLIGPLIAIVAATILGSLISPLVALWTVGYTILMLVGIEYFFERRSTHQERRWGVLVILVMLMLGDAFGVAGLIVAPPLAIALQFLINGLLERAPNSQEANESAARNLAQIQARLETVRARLAEADSETSPRLVNLLERLETLLAQAEQNRTNAPRPAVDKFIKETHPLSGT